VAAKLAEAEVRAASDLRREKLSAKIRDAELEKVPYMLIVGDREVENGTVSVRARPGGDLGSMKLEDFLIRLKEREASRR